MPGQLTSVRGTWSCNSSLRGTWSILLLGYLVNSPLRGTVPGQSFSHGCLVNPSLRGAWLILLSGVHVPGQSFSHGCLVNPSLSGTRSILLSWVPGQFFSQGCLVNPSLRGTCTCTWLIGLVKYTTIFGQFCNLPHTSVPYMPHQPYSQPLIKNNWMAARDSSTCIPRPESGSG